MCPTSNDFTPPEENSSGLIDANPVQLAETDAPFPIVGIAASAGGLEAFTELLSQLPD